MRMLGRMAGLLALAACAAPGTPRPAEVRLTPADLVVRMSDGTRCLAPWQAGQGRMDPCGIDWQVIPAAQPNPLRLIVAGLVGAIGLEEVVVPMADVVLTGADGRSYGYAFPERAETR